VSRELLRLAEENGVRCLFDSPVAEILVEEEKEEEEREEEGTDGLQKNESPFSSSSSPSAVTTTTKKRPKPHHKTTGVRLSSGQQLEADLVISNVDLPFTNKYLFPPPFSQSFDHDKREFSSSVVSFLWALNKTMSPGLKHHTTFLAAREKEDGREEGREGGKEGGQGYKYPGKAAWDALFKNNKFDSTWFNFYVHAPQRTDESVCPPGHDAIMILVPCPILGKEGGGGGAEQEEEEEEELISSVREAVLGRLEEVEGMQDFRDCLTHEKVIGPREWRERYSLSRGAVFGLRHNLGQLSLLRPGQKHRGGGREGGRVEGVYYCGASSRPGNGVPLVMVGAKLLSERIVKECF